MTRRHSSPTRVEPAIVDDSAPVAPVHTRPTWWRVGRVRAIAFTCVGLAVALALASALLSWRAAQVSYEQAEASTQQAEAVDRRLQVLEDDLAVRRDQAQQADDASAARFREFACALLDTYPEEVELDGLRARYGCTLAADLPTPAAGTASTPSAGDPAAAADPGDASEAPPLPASGPEPLSDTQPAPGTAPAAPPPPAPGTTPTEPPPAPPAVPALEPDRGVVGDLLCTLRLLC